MNRFIARNVIAFLAIAGGMAYIIMNEPPHTVCDSQLEVFKKSQQTFLFKDPKRDPVLVFLSLVCFTIWAYKIL